MGRHENLKVFMTAHCFAATRPLNVLIPIKGGYQSSPAHHGDR